MIFNQRHHLAPRRSQATRAQLIVMLPASAAPGVRLQIRHFHEIYVRMPDLQGSDPFHRGIKRNHDVHRGRRRQPAQGLQAWLQVRRVRAARRVAHDRHHHRKPRNLQVCHLLHLQKGIARPGQVAHEFTRHIHDQRRHKQRQALDELAHVTMLLRHPQRHARQQHERQQRRRQQIQRRGAQPAACALRKTRG